MYPLILLIASVLGLTGVGLGAFAAHGLRSELTASALAVFQTGVQYQLLHALVLVAIGLAAISQRNAWLSAAACFIVLGVVLFSGSLYLLVLTPLKLGLVTPLGGLLLMLGWLCLGVSSVRLMGKKTVG
ncbi:hypothetical protein AKN87_08960 [Thiopseudomonas alkaliphila]|uniref:DUF423 domain-containing protein n=1 Tax=Thiopseudomonas alkaliphila TaxID=1697053 RepID=A0AAW7DSD8_9GAMM|nr:DUF423 domain-containing protein [Thiopseudomonas alkaliphila]AKX45197.1 hypothetical protein AKN87_08960 [Thiopseudomonas alkaliphila]AKX47260.1 hypothetical protein AKN94_07715 [Thiopseudomonas alkaliphila]AKX48516.1 hypothetical protein AKN93_03225 [Thiopseudomonas alkaliphila]AKX51092.1 hypothetical protein AKN92_05915 [Thiopseudomonas alkaliphila]AKX53638.1 hypothetical protein AKN91_08165 [Thiopseudomonas alkaliphila]